MNQLREFVESSVLKEFKLNSRVHLANSYFGDNKVYIKRDDELSSGIIGTKLRKYVSLIPALVKAKKPVIAVGSLHSNNLVSLAQILIEFDINFKVVAKDANATNTGNGLWLKTLVGDNLILLERKQWNQHEEWIRVNYPDHLVLPEGASINDCIPGLLTLSLEINDWIEEQNIQLEHLFLDAGTSFSAAVCCAGLAICENSPKNIHITHIAGNETLFEQQLRKIETYLEASGFNIPELPFKIFHHNPKTAKSFGAVNSTIAIEWKQIMQQEGIITDLTYGAKHFYTIKEYLSHKQGHYTALIVNSGNSFAARNHEHILTTHQ